MSDQGLDRDTAPISRKQRLMAAFASGEECAMQGSGSKAEPSGSALLYCFICGGGISRGKELKLQVKYQTESVPFFPFLQHQEPAPGAEELAPDGCVLVCAVCQCFLGEQWNSFERSRTPIEKRMYWLKRPYQCDSRRISQEWNISYDLERRISVSSSQNFDAQDSDLSSLSENENISDQELEAERPVCSKDKTGKHLSSGKNPKDLVTKSSGQASAEMQRGSRYLADGQAAQGALKTDAGLRSGHYLQNSILAAQATGSTVGFCEFQPQRCYDPLSAETPVQNNGLIMRNKQWPTEGNAKHPGSCGKSVKNSCRETSVQLHADQNTADVGDAASRLSPVGALKLSDHGGDPMLTKMHCKASISSNRGGYSSEDNEINITSDDEQEVFVATSKQEAAKYNTRARESGSVITKSKNEAANEEQVCCYICGSQLSPTSQHQIFVQKQERTSTEPFFPFLWLHTPPPGATPLSRGGSTLVCTCCHSSLMQQWKSFEVANVHVLQRLYVVPLNSPALGIVSKVGETNREDEMQTMHEACYLCGEDCSNDFKVVHSRTLNGNTKNIMHFPFINVLPCPPNSKAINKQWEVHSCKKCYTILEDIWTTYRACQNEELINSVHGFLERYHQVFSGAAHTWSFGHPSVNTGHASVCYLCGVDLEAGKEFQLNVNPPSRCGDREPFFPFLTVHPPAPRARPVDSTGLVTTCVLCYHDLVEQWIQFDGTSSRHLSSPWSRQYKVETFVCFFCRQERKRCLGLKAVQVARLPVFLCAPRACSTLLVDDGKQLIIGACAECKAVVLVGQNLKQCSLPDNKSTINQKVAAASTSFELPAISQKATVSSAHQNAGESSEGSREAELQTSPQHSLQTLLNVEEEHRDQTTSMSHEPKSPSLGMISTATRNTATVSPLNPSPLNGSLVPNGSPAANSSLSVQSAPSSSFAAALRKLAKQAEEPRGSSISSESSPVSSPATNHSSPASTPKRGPIGPIIVPAGGHNVPSTPPVVTIAPTKTVNGVWRSEGRQPEAGSRGSSRDRLIPDPQLQQEKAGGPSVPSHLLGTPYPFGLTPNTVVQDSRFPPLNSLQRPVHHVVPPSSVAEDYLRGFRPYPTAEDLRIPSIQTIGLDPAAAAAYYHTGYLSHPPFTHPAFRMDDSYCLSALRSPFYTIPTPGSLPPLHPSAMHLHLSGVRYPTDLSHSSLSALQSDRMSSLTAERLQIDEELRQREREREREREKEREREADREREKEREREREREKELEREREKERERERELERQRERAREKEMSSAKALENHFLQVPEFHVLRNQQMEERTKPVERLTPNRPDKAKEPTLSAPKPVQPTLHQPAATHHSVPSLISSSMAFAPPGGNLTTSMLAQRTNEEEKWLARQRRMRQEKEDRQYQVSEFRQQVLEQHLDIGRPNSQSEMEQRVDSHRSGPSRHEASIRDQPLHLGGPPPLISPKPQHIPPPTSLWNPVSLMDNNTDSRRNQENHAPNTHTTQYEPSRHSLPLVKTERIYSSDKPDESTKRREVSEKYQPIRDQISLEHAGHSYGPFLAELEKSTQTILNQQRASLSLTGQYGDVCVTHKPSSPYRHSMLRGPDPMCIYDEFLHQHRRLVSKLDLEEKRRREAREKGYYYDLDDSYDESDEEEVRAHLRRVAEQPPLKLDTSSEKLDFLTTFGLTTQSQKEKLLAQKRRKRRRLLRERSPSPPLVQNKRQTPSPQPPLTTSYTPEEMNNTPNFEEKKKFLTAFNLAHLNSEQRKDQLMPQPPMDSERPPSTTSNTPPVPELHKTVDSSRFEQGRPHEASRPKELALISTDKIRSNEVQTSGKKNLSMLNSIRGHPPKDSMAGPPYSVNGKNKSWETFVAEDFAHQFHESVLQSTQKALQKHKVSTMVLTAEQNHKVDASIHYNIPELQTSTRTPLPQQNGQHEVQQARKGLTQEPEADSDETEEEEEEEEEEAPRPKWQGIEAVFEAYQEYMEEQNIERQVLQTQCRRLEAQHYSLSLTAEQLSHSMAELTAQKQKLASERERIHAELEHLRKCLALPAVQWSRGYYKGYPR
ncbi:genetic suppressor element 1 isoform X3 [Latimeria chalumnae]|uniref:genetic suppressor element 1 isoform X3 n=1 Tax=Latimeria chalumnae TaxID=7897 RepID=UPI00313D25DB